MEQEISYHSTSAKCGTCQNLGDQVQEDWMMPEESWHECEQATAEIGLVEAGMDACGHYKQKEEER